MEYDRKIIKTDGLKLLLDVLETIGISGHDRIELNCYYYLQ
jgi:hypothetical protein